MIFCLFGSKWLYELVTGKYFRETFDSGHSCNDLRIYQIDQGSLLRWLLNKEGRFFGWYWLWKLMSYPIVVYDHLENFPWKWLDACWSLVTYKYSTETFRSGHSLLCFENFYDWLEMLGLKEYNLYQPTELCRFMWISQAPLACSCLVQDPTVEG